jgi:hypothetical protein
LTAIFSEFEEMAIYLGYVCAGWLGLIVGGVCFIFPAAVLVAALAWMYTRFGALPQTAGVLYGIRPIVVAIIDQAVWRLGRAAVTDVASVVVGVGAARLSLAALGTPHAAPDRCSGRGRVTVPCRWKSSGSGEILPTNPFRDEGEDRTANHRAADPTRPRNPSHRATSRRLPARRAAL